MLKNLLSNVMAEVIALLSSDLFIRSCFEFLLTRVVVGTSTYLEGVRSKLELGFLEYYVSQLFQRFDGKKHVRLLYVSQVGILI